MDLIELIRDKQESIYIYNITIAESPRGPRWARVFSYSCLSFVGDDEHYRDFVASELWEAMQHCHTEDDLFQVLWYSMLPEHRIEKVPIELNDRIFHVTVSPPTYKWRPLALKAWLVEGF